jgi:hypothetical protein
LSLIKRSLFICFHWLTKYVQPFENQVKFHLPFVSIIRSSPYSPLWQVWFKTKIRYSACRFVRCENARSLFHVYSYREVSSDLVGFILLWFQSSSNNPSNWSVTNNCICLTLCISCCASSVQQCKVKVKVKFTLQQGTKPQI